MGAVGNPNPQGEMTALRPEPTPYKIKMNPTAFESCFKSKLMISERSRCYLIFLRTVIIVLVDQQISYH